MRRVILHDILFRSKNKQLCCFFLDIDLLNIDKKKFKFSIWRVCVCVCYSSYFFCLSSCAPRTLDGGVLGGRRPALHSAGLDGLPSASLMHCIGRDKLLFFFLLCSSSEQHISLLSICFFLFIKFFPIYLRVYCVIGVIKSSKVNAFVTELSIYGPFSSSTL